MGRGKDKKPRAQYVHKKGEESPLWKGDNITYASIHSLLHKYKTKPKECVYCGSEKNIEWASISHKAKRDLNDFIPLCKKCHATYDQISLKLSKKIGQFTKDGKLIKIWESGKKAGIALNISPTTIADSANNRKRSNGRGYDWKYV